VDIEKIRADFPVLQREVGGKKIAYFDNAASTLKPKAVIDAVNRYYSEVSTNVHRGIHKLSEEATREWEGARKNVADFVGAGKEELIFTRNTSESINLVMYALREQGLFGKGDRIVTTKMEHHSNMVPWQFCAKSRGAELDYVGLTNDYLLDMEELKEKITKNKNVKLVAVAHVSNTVGTINPIREIAKIAHDAGALVVVDGAQAVPHMPVDVKALGADFYAFSGYKMLGPTGIGMLYGKKELLEEMPPFLYGGDMIMEVKLEGATWNELPHKFEAGTPHIAGGFGMAAAVDYLSGLGMENVRNHEKELTRYALEKLGEVKGLNLYCPKNPERQGASILFDSPVLEPHDLALALDEAENIAVRSGMHCAEPLIGEINPKGLCRASFYIYNTKEEIDLLAGTLGSILGAFG